MFRIFFFILVLFCFVSGTRDNPSYDGYDELLEFYQTYGSFKYDHNHGLPLTFLARGFNGGINNDAGFDDHSSFLEVLNGNGVLSRSRNAFIHQAEKLLDKTNNIYQKQFATDFIVVKFKDVTKVDLDAFMKKYGLIATENNNIGNYYEYKLPGLTKKFLDDPIGVIQDWTENTLNIPSITEWSARTFDFPFVQKIVTALRDDADLEYVHLQTLHPIRTDEYEMLYKKDPKFKKQLSLKVSRVPTVWDDFEYTGKGVHIGFVDNGIDRTNKEFAGRYKKDLEVDITSGEWDLKTAKKHKAIHGTMCAGIAAAGREDGQCGVGVAYGATISSIRLIPMDKGGCTDFQTAKAWSFKINDIDISSNSWGMDYEQRTINGVKLRPELEYMTPEIHFALANAVTKGRNGKGSIFVTSAGNSKYSQGNTNYQQFKSSRFFITIGAVYYHKNGKGIAAPYSNLGATVWVSAGAGFPTSSLGNKCEDVFHGTSAACPFVAGVIALMLEANKGLSYRDVKDILALSAIKVDKDNSNTWDMNGAGLHYSEEFGFGLVDAAEAVKYARVYKSSGYTMPPIHRYTTKTIKVYTKIMDWKPLIKKVKVGDNFIVEHADLYLRLMHERRGDLEISLKSPQGTVCYLTHPHLNDKKHLGANYNQRVGKKYKNFYLPTDGYRFGCSHVFRESAKGYWQIKVHDKRTKGNMGVSTWENFQLTLYGHRIKKPVPLFQAAGVLNVNVKDGREMMRDSTRAPSNPYIKIVVGDITWKTGYRRDEPHPSFLEQHDFELHRCPLHIDVQAWNHAEAGKDSLIGKGRLDLQKVALGPVGKIWDFLVILSGNSLVHLSVMYKPLIGTQ